VNKDGILWPRTRWVVKEEPWRTSQNPRDYACK